MKRAAAVVGLALALGGGLTGGEAEARPARAPRPAHGTVDKQGRPAGPLASGEVRVVDPGAMPRTVLRYQVPVGARVRMGLTMKMAFDAGDVPVPAMPPMTFVLDAECLDVEPGGAMVFEARFVSFTAEGNGPMASAAQQVSTMMKDLVYRFRTTPAGEVDDVSVTGLTGAMAPLGAQMKDQLEQMSIPLPSTAVGRGAVWMAKRIGGANGLTMTLVYRYRLREVRGAVVSFDVTGTVSAAPQPLTQNGLTFFVDHLDGTTAGALSLDLSRYAPAGALSVKMHMIMTAPATKLDMRMTMDTAFTAR